jgi:hypothetical protein
MPVTKRNLPPHASLVLICSVALMSMVAGCGKTPDSPTESNEATLSGPDAKPGMVASDGKPTVGQAVFSVCTVGLSWLYVHIIFALHYAHGFYAPRDDGKGDQGGLIFPGEEDADYWDFLHFALIIGVACQTADVQISDRGVRRLSSVHSLTAFVFNTVIVALAVNLAVGALGAA